MPVNSTHPSYSSGLNKIKLIEHLYYTPDEMLASGTYLVKEPEESDQAFKARVQRSRLYNFFQATVDSLAGLAFAIPVEVQNLPEQLKPTTNNFNGSGRSITDVAHELFINNLLYGYCAMLTEAPVLPEDATIADAYDHLPYGVIVSPKSLFAWNTEYRNGKTETTRLRYSYNMIEESPIDEFDYEEAVYINAVYADRVDVYRHVAATTSGTTNAPFVGQTGSSSKETWELVDTRTSDLGYIPITTSYTEYDGDYVITAPLKELAELNKYHYQSLSDQVNILRIARVPFLLATGFKDSELDNVSLGVNRMITTTASDADIKFIEHQGNSIDAGRMDLLDILNFAEKVGANLLSAKAADRQTATARSLDQVEALSVIQLTLRNIEKQLYDHYQICGDYLGIDCSEVVVKIGSDVSIPSEPNPIASLIGLGDAGFTVDQIANEGKRRGILDKNLEVSDDQLVREQPASNSPVEAETEQQDDE